MRREPTEAERRLWGGLRAGRLGTVKLKRQAPVGPYIVDFIAKAERLIIEVDGGQHGEQIGYDERRTAYLEAQGYRVLRFWNNEVPRDVSAVLDAVYAALFPLPPASRAPASPASGRGDSGRDLSPLPPGGRGTGRVSGQGKGRITAAFANSRAALITFVTAGDPSPDHMPAILDALVEGGADVIELGMPFSDPMADGPAIQAANLRALGAGITLERTLGIAADFSARHADTPLILMGYMNPILAFGAGRFAAAAAQAGVDGVLIVDLPPEEAPDLAPELAANGLHLIRLATPTTDARRLPAVLDGASGFLYYVSVAGVTGANSAAEGHIEAACQRLKAATDLPVAVGFGIRTPEQAAAVARHADGVVIGSAIIETIAAAHAARANDLAEQVRAQVAALRAAMDRA